jgi:hypothetical protein
MKKTLIRLLSIVVLILLVTAARHFYPKSELPQTELPVQEQIKENNDSSLPLSEEKNEIITGENTQNINTDDIALPEQNTEKEIEIEVKKEVKTETQ